MQRKSHCGLFIVCDENDSDSDWESDHEPSDEQV
eukprot:COSAG06_NODE_626_length_13665_cov_18.589619_1_plen_33_part_10